jgi:3-oxoacyl-[acyl-carrier protein] reductase
MATTKIEGGRIEGKRVALITGGGRGIGRAAALALAKDGVIPLIADIDEKAARSVAEELRKLGVPSEAYKVDVSKVDQIAAMVAAIKERFGRLDILVNNAGVLSKDTVLNVTEAEWSRVMDINLKGVAFLTQHALPLMIANDWGRIINISSMAGRMGGISAGFSYAVSKAAVIGLTMSIARRVAANHITVNAIAPGPTESELFNGFTEEERLNLAKAIPVGRLGKPENIGDTIAFIASESAGFMTGAVLDMNGGAFMG